MTEKNTFHQIIRPLAVVAAGILTVGSLAACGQKDEPMMKDDKGGMNQEAPMSSDGGGMDDPMMSDGGGMNESDGGMDESDGGMDDLMMSDGGMDEQEDDNDMGSGAK